MKRVSAALITLMMASVSWSAVEVSAVFADRAVLQSGKDLPVWGWGKPGDTVSVSFAGQTETTTVEADGSWRVTLSPVAASYAKYTMVISVGAESVTFTDMLVGEVWLCTGQSNMLYTLDALAGRSKDAGYQSIIDFITNERDTAQDEFLRIVTVPTVASFEKGKRSFNGQWLKFEQGNSGSFSGTAYFFAKELRQRLNCPVGVIACAWGGQRIDGFIPPSGWNYDPWWKVVYENTVSEYTALMDVYETQLAAYLAAHAEWELNPVGPEPEAPVPPDYDQPVKPAAIYNGMIHPLVPYALKGVLWYQGESHSKNRPDWYGAQMKMLVSGLRTEWGQDDLPFYYCQLANFMEPLPEPTTPPATWVIISHQQRLSLKIPNTGMAVLNDIGQTIDIHPKNKLDVGLRLSRWALNKTYGFGEIYPSGPLYNSSLNKEHAISIRFDYSGSGLMVGRKTLLDPVVPISDPLGGFQICGEDRVWMWGDAQIVGTNEVEVSHPSIARPVAVRYAWQANPRYSNLYNQEGLPTSLFATIEPELHGMVTNLSSYAAWVQSYGLSGSDAERTADPDADGYENMLEYALGLNPIVVDADGKNMLPVSGAEATIILPQTARQDLLYRVLRSTDSTTWETFASRWKDNAWEGSYAVQDPASGVRTVRFTVPEIYTNHLFKVVALDADSNPPNGAQLTLIGQDDFDGTGTFLSRQNSGPINRELLIWNVVNRTNVGDGSIIDTSVFLANGDVGDGVDTTGFLESTKTDNLFAMYRGGAGGPRSLTYSFDISGYSDLTLSMDWAASGDIPDPNIFVTTAIDGAAPIENFRIGTSSVGWSETMENGTVVNRPRRASVTVNGSSANSLSDLFKTYTVPVSGTGNVLVVKLTMAGSVAGPALGMDNLKLFGVAPKQMTYDAWIEYYGLSGSNALWASDMDGDNRNNLEEFAFGGNPLDGEDAGYAPSGTMIMEDGTPFLEYVYARRTTLNHGLIYVVETCSNLVSNDWTTGGSIELPGTGIINTDFEAVTNRIVVIDDAGFVRLRVEQEP